MAGASGKSEEAAEAEARAQMAGVGMCRDGYATNVHFRVSAALSVRAEPTRPTGSGAGAHRGSCRCAGRGAASRTSARAAGLPLRRGDLVFFMQRLRLGCNCSLRRAHCSLTGLLASAAR